MWHGVQGYPASSHRRLESRDAKGFTVFPKSQARPLPQPPNSQNLPQLVDRVLQRGPWESRAGPPRRRSSRVRARYQNITHMRDWEQGGALAVMLEFIPQ